MAVIPEAGSLPPGVLDRVEVRMLEGLDPVIVPLGGAALTGATADISQGVHAVLHHSNTTTRVVVAPMEEPGEAELQASWGDHQVPLSLNQPQRLRVGHDGLVPAGTEQNGADVVFTHHVDDDGGRSLEVRTTFSIHGALLFAKAQRASEVTGQA